jgi:hypothetical protein
VYHTDVSRFVLWRPGWIRAEYLVGSSLQKLLDDDDGLSNDLLGAVGNEGHEGAHAAVGHFGQA